MIQYAVSAYMSMFPQILTAQSSEHGKLSTEKLGMFHVNFLNDVNSRVDSKHRLTLLMDIMPLRCSIEIIKLKDENNLTFSMTGRLSTVDRRLTRKSVGNEKQRKDSLRERHERIHSVE